MTYPIPLWLALLVVTFSNVLTMIGVGLVCSRKRGDSE